MTVFQNTIRYFVTIILATFVMTANASESEIVEQPHLRAQLIAEYSQVEAGQTFDVAVKLVPDPGWHTYWINPGDSGLATVINWQLPEGVSVGPIQWPIAEKYNIGHLSNYGFEGDTYLLSSISVSDQYAAPTLPITADVDWLVCEEYCIPGSATLSIELHIGSPERATGLAEAFSTARNNLPEVADWQAYFDIQDRQVTIIVNNEQAANLDNGSLYAFIGATELVEHQPPGSIQSTASELIIRRELNTYFHDYPEQFPLLLVNNERAVQLEVQVAEQGAAANLARSTHSASAPLSLTTVLFFALAGGFILNLMPCVFPVLSLKALHLANHRDHARRDALWYTAGVVVTFVLIAAVLIALRATGAALGWGFQLQNPILIGLLALLFVAIALNLSGVFQIGTSLMRLGQGQQQQSSFATGVLAVVIASPCTAPFMGIALGFAIIQPAPIALTIFAALGLGMALPFLLLGFFPLVARWLPKPGAWMNTFKEWMAIPMYLTTVWLLWVFGRQAGIDSLALLLIALILFATALWAWGKGQLQPSHKSRQVLLSWLFIALTAFIFSIALQNQQVGERSAPASQQWQAWTPELQRKLQASQPVFVNMTADWCITCLANERVALETDATRALFAENDIRYLKGDWTLQDPRITEYLASYQRNGVPLYVLYWPGQEPVVLPQILTNSIVRDAVEQAKQSI